MQYFYQKKCYECRIDLGIHTWFYQFRFSQFGLLTLHIPSYQKFRLYPFIPSFFIKSGCPFCKFVGEHTYGQNFEESRLTAIVYEIT